MFYFDLNKSSEVVDAIDKDSPVAVGDNLVVYYGDKHATTYDAKVINTFFLNFKYYNIYFT